MKEKDLRKRISKMSLREKLLEMTQFNYTELGLDQTGDVTGILYVSGMEKGDLRSLGSVLNVPSAEEALRFRKLREEMGVKEPVLIMRDIIHGCRVIYPIPLAMACSFDLPLIEECAEMAANIAKYMGIDVTFSPMVDLARDPRWGRVMESAGEDPYLTGEVGKAFIRGYHKGGIASCVKHFAGYGAVEAGREYNTTDISERSLREYYMRGYQACLDENPELFMSAFNLLNGIPASASEWLMSDVLRTEWGFDGVLISDWGSVTHPINHGYAEDGKACAVLGIKTKHDIEMCTTSFWDNLTELVEEGTVKEEQIDESVFRVLQLKNKLGLYENPNRCTDPEKWNELCVSEEYRALARRAAEDSVVLLKNDGVLPLAQSDSVGFVGPYFDTKELIGNWAAHGRLDETVTIRQGIENLLGREAVGVLGCSWGLLETDESGIGEAVEAMKGFEKIVVFAGEPRLSSGEHHSRADIRLPKVQRKLIKRLHELGKPIVLVVFAGRPQILKDVEPLVSAILYAWHPGTEGGNAVANILYGKAVPSAKTTMTFPRSMGQIPLYYNHFNTGHPKHDDSVIVSDRNFGSCYDDEFNAPLYPFGYGLSYTSFAYSDFTLSETVMKRGGKIVASVCVENTGNYDGKEVVQWYIHDRFGSYARPVKELKGFEKISLKRGEKKTVRFEITEETLAFYTASGEFKAECGDFELFVGGNSRDCMKLSFKLVEN